MSCVLVTPQKRELDFILECLIKIPIPVHTCNRPLQDFKLGGKNSDMCSTNHMGVRRHAPQEITLIFTFSDTDSKAVFLVKFMLTLKKNVDT